MYASTRALNFTFQSFPSFPQATHSLHKENNHSPIHMLCVFTLPNLRLLWNWNTPRIAIIWDRFPVAAYITPLSLWIAMDTMCWACGVLTTWIHALRSTLFCVWGESAAQLLNSGAFFGKEKARFLYKRNVFNKPISINGNQRDMTRHDLSSGYIKCPGLSPGRFRWHAADGLWIDTPILGKPGTVGLPTEFHRISLSFDRKRMTTHFLWLDAGRFADWSASRFCAHPVEGIIYSITSHNGSCHWEVIGGKEQLPKNKASWRLSLVLMVWGGLLSPYVNHIITRLSKSWIESWKYVGTSPLSLRMLCSDSPLATSFHLDDVDSIAKLCR